MLPALFPQELTLKQFLISGLAEVKALSLSWRQLQELFPVPSWDKAPCPGVWLHSYSTGTVSTATCGFPLLC